MFTALMFTEPILVWTEFVTNVPIILIQRDKSTRNCRQTNETVTSRCSALFRMCGLTVQKNMMEKGVKCNVFEKFKHPVMFFSTFTLKKRYYILPWLPPPPSLSEKHHIILFWTFTSLPQPSVFFSNYTTLAMLAILYCFVVKSKINSAKRLPPIGIEPVTQGLCDLLWYTLMPSWLILTNVTNVNWGILNFTCVGAPIYY